MSEVRTRFAPSPTGFLHIGGVRTALFNYLFAKQQQGTFMLRLEDTDRERFVSEGVEQIVAALDWLGLKPDEGFWMSEGKHQNIEFVQSERQKTGIYQKYAEQLVREGLAYYSPTSPSELEKFREQAKKDKKPFLYKHHMDPNNSKKNQENAPIRFDVQKFFQTLEPTKSPYFQMLPGKHIGNVVWDDKTSKQATWSSVLIDDFIIMKADGFPTYNFANVIDDYDMKISHVMRGNEFISSTPKHIILYHALGFAPLPQFVHLPVINGTDGKKLSKRTGDTNALDYREKGYLPEAILNFLALLGWNDGTEQEIFSMNELVEKFSLERIHTSPAVFDLKRLDWVNGHYIRQLPLDDLFDRVIDFWPPEAGDYDSAYRKQVLGLVQERLKYFAELPELTTFFFKDLPLDPDLIASHKQLKKLSKEELLQLLKQAKNSLEASDFSLQDLTQQLNDLLTKTGQKPVILFSLIRIATTQAPASPALAETLAVLGKELTLKRLQEQLEALQ